jgi:putative transposase
MSRPLRIEYPGAWYHVMNRGRRSDLIFKDGDDYLFFIDILKDIIELWDARISAFCLMPNHYHMLINTPKGNISRCMRHVDGVYTQRFNRSHGLDGTLFRGRYKSILVDGDSYLLQLVRYIHRNPVRAGIVNDPQDYMWSSHKAYFSARKWSWLHRDFILSILSGEKGRQLKAYRKFMAEDDSEEITEIFEGKKWPVFLGDDDFLKRLKRKYFEEKRNNQIPESAELSPELEDIKKEVSDYYRVAQSDLMKSRRGRFNEPRSMAIYLARMMRKDSLMDISAEFNLGGYSSASSVIQGMKKHIEKNRKLQGRHEKLKKALLSR